MGIRKTFGAISDIADLNRLNDAQKGIYDLIAADDPTLSEKRLEAYLNRWREALVFVEPGSCVLDIGAGWVPERVWSLLLDEYKLNYHSIDIDEKLIAHAANRLQLSGLPSDNAKIAMNTSIPYPDNYFDFIFSSHCLEHSVDLAQTFSEMHRVMKPFKSIFFAVPFGFDHSDEHLVYLEYEDWLTVAELGGFEILNCHLGKTYGLTSWDVAIIGRRNAGRGDLESISSFIKNRSKVDHVLAPFDDSIFKHHTDAVRRSDCIIYQNETAGYTVSDTPGLKNLLHVHHPWSGIVRISNGGTQAIVDLYSRYHHIGATDVSHMPGPLRVEIIGKNAASNASELVLVGAVLGQGL